MATHLLPGINPDPRGVLKGDKVRMRKMSQVEPTTTTNENELKND